MKVIIILATLALPVFAQDYSGTEVYEEDLQVYREEGSPYSENPAYTDDVVTPPSERQEEEQFFDEASVEQDWSLENEELPAEEYVD